MVHLSGRRRIDWYAITTGDPPRLRRAEPTEQSARLAALASDLTSDPSPAKIDGALRSAVEFSRTVVGLERSAIFLVDTKNRAMVGTWGTDIHGNTVDEHALAYEFGSLDREVFARSQAGFPWTVYEDCPLITQVDGETRVVGRGWIACTAIRGRHGSLGILFNDSAITHCPVDETKQSRVAVLCSLLGQSLERCRVPLVPADQRGAGSAHPLVDSVTNLLARDPTMSCAALAERLHISAGRLARTFKREANTSVVDHRNELRLARFLRAVDPQGRNLLDAALDAGFGSYAQFHRVFRERFGRPPREYLVEQGLRRRQSHEA